MQAALATRGDARAVLTHLDGSGLDDDRYVIQRYLSHADGDIVPIDLDGAKPDRAPAADRAPLVGAAPAYSPDYRPPWRPETARCGRARRPTVPDSAAPATAAWCRQEQDRVVL